MAWIAALKEWNTDKDIWTIPKRGTPEHGEVMEIMATLKKKGKGNTFRRPARTPSAPAPPPPADDRVVYEQNPMFRRTARIETPTDLSRRIVRSRDTVADMRSLNQEQMVAAQNAERERMINTRRVFPPAHLSTHPMSTTVSSQARGTGKKKRKTRK